MSEYYFYFLNHGGWIICSLVQTSCKLLTSFYILCCHGSISTVNLSFLGILPRNHYANIEIKDGRKVSWLFHLDVFLYSRSTGGGYTVLPLSVLPFVCPSIHPKIFFVAFFWATIDGRNLIFGHKLHIGTPYHGKLRGYHKWALAHSSSCFSWCIYRNSSVAGYQCQLCLLISEISKSFVNSYDWWNCNIVKCSMDGVQIFFLLLVKNLKSDEATPVQYNFNLPLYRIIFIKSFWKVLNLLNPRWIRFFFAKFAVLENKTIVRLPWFNKTKIICWINRIVFIAEQIKKYLLYR